MLSPDIIKALTQYTASMTKPVTIQLSQGEHDSRQQLIDFLTEICQVSTNLTFEICNNIQLPSALSFTLTSDDQPTGILFSGIPSGHEFNSLILAILQAGGAEIKLDDRLKSFIQAIDFPLNFEVFVSLSCHNCPDVVQALNQLALLNEYIKVEMIDGALFPERVEQYQIQGVPAVFLNGKSFSNGKVDTAQIIEKLLSLFPNIAATKLDQSLPEQDVTVIGGGPAGVSAAIYAARKGLKVTLIAETLGGQVKDTVAIENLISVPQTTGKELAQALQQHISDYDITVRENVRVSSIKNDNIKTIKLNTQETIRSKTLIVATGAKWRTLNVPGETENVGKGVAYCPHCDGPFFKDKNVAVVGGGNSGIEAALDLSGIVKKVTVLEFADTLKADKVLIEKAQQTPNIEIITSAQSTEVIDNGEQVTALAYLDRNTQVEHKLAVDGIFVQIGLAPNSGLVSDLVDLQSNGEIIIDEKGRTSADGIFACGDVTTVPYKQIVIAMGEGAKAALSAFDYLLMHTH